MKKENIKNIKNILLDTQSDITVNKLDLDGFSGSKLLYTLHKLTSTLCSENTIYLEIGVFTGLTLLTNSNQNKHTKCYGIDNFSLFDVNNENKEFIKDKADKYKLENCLLIDADYEDALDNLKSYIGEAKVGVYFIDGAHDYRSQLVALLQIKPFLSEDSVIVIDDANYPHVRQATNDFLKAHPEFALLFEAYTKSHPYNMDDSDFNTIAKDGWWNGVNIIVNDSSNNLQRGFTEEANKDLYFITHDIFRNKFANLSYDIIKLAQNSKFDELEEIMRLYSKESNNYEHQNTYSDALTKFNIL
tara:strand:- start:606 stop:1511 length:906 start_codon:yes stop_codon:yes gene_type:complete